MSEHSRILFWRHSAEKFWLTQSDPSAQAQLHIWRFALLGHRVPLCYLAKWCQSGYQNRCHGPWTSMDIGKGLPSLAAKWSPTCCGERLWTDDVVTDLLEKASGDLQIRISLPSTRCWGSKHSNTGFLHPYPIDPMFDIFGHLLHPHLYFLLDVSLPFDMVKNFMMFSKCRHPTELFPRPMDWFKGYF